MTNTKFYYTLFFNISGLMITNLVFYICFFLRFETVDLELENFTQDSIGYKLVLVLLNFVFLISSSKNDSFLYEKNNILKNAIYLAFKDTFL